MTSEQIDELLDYLARMCKAIEHTAERINDIAEWFDKSEYNK